MPSLIPPRWIFARSAADIAILLVLFGVALRHITGPLVAHFGTASGDTHGSAAFATHRETASLNRTDAGLLVGWDRRTSRLVRYDVPAYLLTADHAVICIDPKGGVSQGPQSAQQTGVAHGGENASVAGCARERFRPLHILDLFSVIERPSATFNPLDAFAPPGLDVAENGGTLAETLVFDEPGQAGEAHWNEKANSPCAGEPSRTRALPARRVRSPRPSHARRAR